MRSVLTRFVLINLFAWISGGAHLQGQTIDGNYRQVRNLYDVAVFQWYDLYSEGVMTKAPEAGKLLDSARILMDRKMDDEAGKLICQAEGLLKHRDKKILDHYLPRPANKETTTQPLSDAGVGDYSVMSRFGVGLWDIAGSFMGPGDDGNFYLIMPLIYFKNTSSVIPPVLCEIISSGDPSKKHMVAVATKPKVIQTEDSLWIEAVEGETRIVYTVRNSGRGKVVTCSGAAPGISFSYTLSPDFTYWFNRNENYAVPYPGTLVAGFEEPGAASGTLTTNGKTVKIGHAAGVSECFYNGPQSGHQLTEFRKVIEQYGNEWYIPFHSPDVSGIFLVYGEFRDAALWIRGNHVVPEKFTITPMDPNKSVRIETNTPHGRLVLDLNCSIWDKQFAEYSGILTGSLNGKSISKGNFLLEHTLMTKDQ
ncbi:MAG: hypothetical protein WCI71_00805 [Bacteroidota bacterium]